MKILSTLWTDIKLFLFTYFLPILLIVIIGMIINISEANMNTLYSSVCSILTIILSILYLRKKGFNCKDAFTKPDLKILILVLLFQFCWAIFSSYFFWAIFSGLSGEEESVVETPLSIIATFTLVPVAEELLFRYGFINLGKQKSNLLCASVISVILFTIMHFDTLPASLTILGAAIFYVMIYNKTGNLVYTICAHAFNNFIGTVGYKFLDPFISTGSYSDLGDPIFIGSVIGLLFSIIVLIKLLKNKTWECISSKNDCSAYNNN